MKTIKFVLSDKSQPPINLAGEQGGYTVNTEGSAGFVSGWVSDGNASKTVVVPFDRLDRMVFEDTEAKK